MKINYIINHVDFNVKPLDHLSYCDSMTHCTGSGDYLRNLEPELHIVIRTDTIINNIHKNVINV